MSGVNKVILLGRLGKDPELSYTPAGMPVCKFSLATSKTWVDKNGQKQEKTAWHNIVVWQKSAENCAKYLTKGRMVHIEGELDYRSWDDKERPGKKCYATDIVAHDVQFIGEQSASKSAQQPAQPQTEMHQSQSPALDDIPF